MNTTISVYTRSTYGQTRIYVSDPAQASHLRTLTGALTPEARHIIALESLGFVIAQVPDPKTVLPLRSLNAQA